MLNDKLDVDQRIRLEAANLAFTYTMATGQSFAESKILEKATLIENYIREGQLPETGKAKN